eukprot:scaffold189165_cov28-Tisochrysis_lutea.AAC.1
MSEVWTGTWHLARRASSFAVFPAQIFTFYGGRRCEPVTCTKPSVRNVFKRIPVCLGSRRCAPSTPPMTRHDTAGGRAGAGGARGTNKELCVACPPRDGGDSRSLARLFARSARQRKNEVRTKRRLLTPCVHTRYCEAPKITLTTLDEI